APRPGSLRRGSGTATGPARPTSATTRSSSRDDDRTRQPTQARTGPRLSPRSPDLRVWIAAPSVEPPVILTRELTQPNPRSAARRRPGRALPPSWAPGSEPGPPTWWASRGPHRCGCRSATQSTVQLAERSVLLYQLPAKAGSPGPRRARP